VAGRPANAAAAYLDVQRLAAADGEQSGQLAPIQAVGFAAGTEEGAVTMLLRVIVEEPPPSTSHHRVRRH
jgi:hypothetical protein